MKLATLRTAAGTKIVAVETGDGEPRFLDLAAADPSLPGDVLSLLAAEDGIVRAAAAEVAASRDGRYLTGELLAPIPRPGKVICIGLNYRDHAAETGAEIPCEPVVFGKFSSTVTGPGATVIIPAAATQVDYEAELVVVIGRRCVAVPAEVAFAHVAGFLCGNDVSARDWQKGRPAGQWLLGKTPEGFAPTGPWLTTADEIPDPAQLAVTLRLNGTVMQSGNTRDFLFGIGEVIAHISRVVTLEPGDLIFTGTPAGVGVARNPPVFLKPGDVTEVEIEGLGVLRNTFAAAG